MHKIFISPGHYHDEPNKGFEYVENRKISTLLEGLLIVNGFAVESAEGKIHEKVAICNACQPDLAIECHFNALHWPATVEYGSGYEVCINSGSLGGRKISAAIVEQFRERLPFGRRGTGVWERTDLYFLKHTKCPAVIIEPLFLDNPFESQYLKMERGHAMIATCVYKAVENYFKS